MRVLTFLKLMHFLNICSYSHVFLKRAPESLLSYLHVFLKHVKHRTTILLYYYTNIGPAWAGLSGVMRRRYFYIDRSVGRSDGRTVGRAVGRAVGRTAQTAPTFPPAPQRLPRGPQSKKS